MTDGTRDPYLDDDTFHFSDGNSASETVEFQETDDIGPEDNIDDIIWDIDGGGFPKEEPIIHEPEIEPDPDDTAIAVPEWSPPPDIWIG